MQSQLDYEEARYLQQSKSISEEIMSLHAQLDRTRMTQNQELRDLHNQLTQEQASLASDYEQAMREAQLRLSSVHRRPADHSELYFQLSRSREENAQLQLELRHIRAERQALESRSEAMTRQELRPLEASLEQSVHTMELATTELSRKHDWEREELQRRATSLDYSADQLRREAELVTESIRRNEQRSQAEMDSLKQRISVYEEELRRLASSSAEVEKEKVLLESKGWDCPVPSRRNPPRQS